MKVGMIYLVVISITALLAAAYTDSARAHVYGSRGIPAPCSTGVHIEKDLMELQLCSDVKMKKMSRRKLFKFANDIAADYECVLYKDKSVVCRLMPKEKQE